MKAKTVAPSPKVVPVRRTAGGDAHAAPVQHARLQPKLSVGAANDPLEHEADRMAERVVAMPAPVQAGPVALAAPPPDDGVRRAETGDGGQPNLDSLPDQPAVPPEHADAVVADSENVDTQSLGTSDMAEIESGAPEGGAAEGGAPAEGAGGESVPSLPPGDDSARRAGGDGAAAAVGLEGGAAPADVSARVTQPGAGRPLPLALRRFMEPRFHADFSKIRIHDSAEDRIAARRIGARAFTYRDHIWIGPGESVEDKRLLAHELTHVVQQTAPPAPAAEEVKREPTPTLRRAVPFGAKLEGYARNIPGYTLLTVILGQSPLTDERVPRTAENLLGGLLGLIPVIGEQIFIKLKETQALQTAFDWVSERMTALNLTGARIAGLFGRIWDEVSITSPIRDLTRLFGPLVSDIVTFVGEITEKVLEFVIRGALKLAGPYADKIWEIIQGARQSLSLILKDPLGFAKNLVGAVVGGFRLFGDNIWTHLKRGLLGWLFGSLEGAGLKLPAKFDLKGLLSLGLQVLGLTYDRFRSKLVKAMDPNGERKMGFIEKGVEIVRILVTEGFAGLWQKIVSMIDGFKQTIVGGIQDFVTGAIVKAGLSWLAALTNPFGAIIKVVMSIYDMIVVFLERLEQIKAVAMSIFQSISEIASGNVEKAAQSVEKSIAGTIPVVISFLAGLLNITGISDKIRKVIARIQEPVDRAMTKLVNFVVGHVKKLFSKLIAKLNSKRKLPSVPFKVGKTGHRLFVKKADRKLAVFIASQEHPAHEVVTATAAVPAKVEEPASRAEAEKLVATLTASVKTVGGAAAAAGDPDSAKKNQNEPLKKVEAAEQAETGKLTATAEKLDEKPAVESAPGPGGGVALIRTREPRFADLEGKQGTHRELKKETGKPIPGTNNLKSTYLEVDHVIEKAFPKAILENLDTLASSKAAVAGDLAIFRFSDRKAKPANETKAEKQAGGKNFALIGDAAYKSIDEDGSQLPSMIVYHRIHTQKAKPLIEHEALIEKAARAPDPHAFLRDSLAKELKHEVDDVARLYHGDSSASDAIKGRIDAGVAALIAANTPIYGLGAVAAGAKAGGPPSGPTEDRANAPFKGKIDFFTVEGAGNQYGRQQSGVGEFIEYDHIIDKSYPLAVQELTLGGAALGAEARAVTAEGLEPAKAAQVDARKASLAGERLFAETTGMGRYTTYNGYSIGLYRPVHHAVTRLVSTDTGGAVAKARAAGAAALVSFVKDGERSQLDVARSAMQASLRATFGGRIDEHASAIRKEYERQSDAVAGFNPGKEDAARAAMARILVRVEASLGEARTRLDALFA